jgi:hypothetical protein
MNVHTFPLVSGQELIVDLVHIDDRFIHVATPMVFQTVRHPETGQAIHGFGEWPALADPKAEGNESIRIPIASVLCMPLVPHEEVVRNYISNITGLELPPAQPKILLS